MYVLTECGREHVADFIAGCASKRKEILDAGKDTAYDTVLPTEEDIVCDINWEDDFDGDLYVNSWGVTDDYKYDETICLKIGADFIMEEVS